MQVQHVPELRNRLTQSAAQNSTKLQVLGRILPDFFPKIFGPKEDEPLDADAAKCATKTREKTGNTLMLPHDENMLVHKCRWAPAMRPTTCSSTLLP